MPQKPNGKRGARTSSSSSGLGPRKLFGAVKTSSPSSTDSTGRQMELGQWIKSFQKGSCWWHCHWQKLASVMVWEEMPHHFSGVRHQDNGPKYIQMLEEHVKPRLVRIGATYLFHQDEVPARASHVAQPWCWKIFMIFLRRMIASQLPWYRSHGLFFSR